MADKENSVQPIVFEYDRYDRFFTGPSLAQLNQKTGEVLVPGDATEVPPPTEWPKGCIPVFCPDKNAWKIRPDTFWRPHITKEDGYDSAESFDGVPQLPAINPLRMRSFAEIPRVFSQGLFNVSFSQRIRESNRRIREIYKIHAMLAQNNGPIDPDLFYQLKLEIEVCIYLFKKSIDEIVTVIYIDLYIERIKECHEIEVWSIGQILAPKRGEDGTGAIVQRIKEAMQFEKYGAFLRVVNDLHNSYKHDIFSSEASGDFGIDEPIITTLKSSRGNLSRLRYYEQSFSHIVLGMASFLRATVLNEPSGSTRKS